MHLAADICGITDQGHVSCKAEQFEWKKRWENISQTKKNIIFWCADEGYMPEKSLLEFSP